MNEDLFPSHYPERAWDIFQKNSDNAMEYFWRINRECPRVKKPGELSAKELAQFAIDKEFNKEKKK